MERSPESSWGTSSPENGVDSSSGSSGKESKSGKKGSEAVRAEQPERQAAQGFARLFGREALQRPAEREVVIPLRAEAAKGEQKEKAEQAAESSDDQHKESSTNDQEREVAAEVVDEAQVRNEQIATRAGNEVEQASAENVGRLLDNMEVGLESAPAEETAEHIIDRTTDETAEALANAEPLSAEMQPLDWPEFASEAQEASHAETSESNPFANNAEATNGAPLQQEQFNRRMYDDEPDQTNTAAPYAAPGAGQGNGGGQPPRTPIVGFNPNATPPFGAAAPASANMAGGHIPTPEASDGLVRGFFLGLLTGGAVGNWLGRRHERRKAERAMAQHERLHGKQVAEQTARYEAQVAESQTRIRTLTERQAYAARQTMRAAEIMPAAAGQTSASERSASAPETRPAAIRTEAPKRVEMMTDAEVHEASRNLRIGDKTLYELKENGTIDATEERTLLRLAEQGGIEDPARKYRFDQEARRVLMRHELDPHLAQQVLQHEREEQSTGRSQNDEQPVPAISLPLGEQSPLAESTSRMPHEQTDVTSSSLRRPADNVSASHPLVIANVIAVSILIGLLLVLLIISVTR